MLGVSRSGHRQGPVSETLAFRRRVGRKRSGKRGKCGMHGDRLLPCPTDRKWFPWDECGAYNEADFASTGAASLLPDPRDKKHCTKDLRRISVA